MEPKTISDASDQTMTSAPVAVTPQPPAPLGGLFARYKAWMAGKPWYYHLAAVLLATLIGGLVGHYVPAAKPYIPDPLTFAAADKATQQPQYAGTAPVADGTEGLLPRGELRKRIAIAFARPRAIERAVRDGLPGPGGTVRKVTREEAAAAVDRVTDDMVVAAAAEAGAPFGEGGRLEQFLSWLWDHREQIIKLILTLAALFADTPN